MGVAITGVPTDKPVHLSLKPGSGNSMDLKFGVAETTTDENNPRRVTWIDFMWVFQASKNMSSSYKEVRNAIGHVTADRLWIRDSGTDVRSINQLYDRNKYHPVVLDRYLTSVTASVFYNNLKSVSHPTDSSRKSSITYAFRNPKVPKWNEPQYETNTGKVACSIVAGANEESYERYDTYYCVTRQDNFTTTYRNETVVKSWTSSKEDSFDVETDRTSEAQSLEEGQWIQITFKAYSRGLRGNSSTVTKPYVIAHPARASITGITVTSLTDSNGLVTVRLNTNSSTYRPVDTVQLQRLPNTAVNTIEMARLASGWEDVANAQDDATCSGLTDTMDNARPNRGNHVWYRIKSTRGTLVQYSDPVKATMLDRDSTPISDDVVTIDSVIPGDDGESLAVIFGWSDDDSNGTEISWSEKADAWNSTNQPTTYNVPDSWKDATSQVSEKPNSAKLIVRGLTEGVPYYVKARRYFDDSSKIEYSDAYCTAIDEQYPVAPVTKPSSVNLKSDAYVKRGEDLEVRWTYEGASDQTKWNLYKNVVVDEVTTKILLASGDDAIGAAVISSDKLESSDDSITLSVSITTGGDWTESNAIAVKIADPPTLIAVTDAYLMAQPMRFYASTNIGAALMIAKVSSKGTFSGTPDGEIVQTDGDTVWSSSFTPSWTIADDGMYYAMTTLPEKMAFMNGIDYVLDVTIVDPETGFSSETQSTTFTVDWAHVARRPHVSTHIDAMQDSKSTRIIPIKPENYVAGDVYDIYRVTSDTIDKIAEGQEYGTEAVDRFAPFGKNVQLYYRIVNRTKDGSVEWRDVPYNLKGHQLRFDWGDGEFIELPYNLKIGDSYGKSYEKHTHLDGSKSGHWNPGFDKNGDFSTKLIRITDAELAKQIRKLGTYAGPVFVRTPDGSAYQANVLVKGLNAAYDDLLLDISINVEALSLSDAFRLAADDFTVVEAQEVPEEVSYERSQILSWNYDAPQSGDELLLNELAVGEAFKVLLSTSYDNYLEPWTVPATYNGLIVTLGTFDSELQAYINRTIEASSQVQYLLTAYYNISEEADETTEETT